MKWIWNSNEWKFGQEERTSTWLIKYKLPDLLEIVTDFLSGILKFGQNPDIPEEVWVLISPCGSREAQYGSKKGWELKVAHLKIAKNENSVQIKLAALSSNSPITGHQIVVEACWHIWIKDWQR